MKNLHTYGKYYCRIYDLQYYPKKFYVIEKKIYYLHSNIFFSKLFQDCKYILQKKIHKIVYIALFRAKASGHSSL